MLLKPGVYVFDQQPLLGLDWPADVRIVFDPKDEQKFLDLRERCAIRFGEVGPAIRDEDDVMSNDRWLWAYKEINKEFRKHLRTQFEFQRARKRRYHMMIVLRYVSMAHELGLDITHLKDHGVRVAVR
jgi:hypothetical protein